LTGLTGLTGFVIFHHFSDDGGETQSRYAA
jgi:hypothetical protein